MPSLMSIAAWRGVVSTTKVSSSVCSVVAGGAAAARAAPNAVASRCFHSGPGYVALCKFCSCFLSILVDLLWLLTILTLRCCSLSNDDLGHVRWFDKRRQRWRHDGLLRMQQTEQFVACLEAPPPLLDVRAVQAEPPLAQEEQRAGGRSARVAVGAHLHLLFGVGPRARLEIDDDDLALLDHLAIPGVDRCAKPDARVEGASITEGRWFGAHDGVLRRQRLELRLLAEPNEMLQGSHVLRVEPTGRYAPPRQETL